MKKVICGVVDELGLSVDNLRETHSRRNFNRYDIAYSPIVAVSELTSRILIETSVMSLGILFHEMPVESMLVEVLKDRHTNMIEEFSLQPFEMKVQSIERTFIDKIFAICDYYMSAQTERHSRHLYDIAKIWEKISPDGTFRDLIEKVRIARRDLTYSPRLKPGDSWIQTAFACDSAGLTMPLQRRLMPQPSRCSLRRSCPDHERHRNADMSILGHANLLF